MRTYHGTQESQQASFRPVKLLLRLRLHVESGLTHPLVGGSLNLDFEFQHDMFHNFSE